MADGAARRLTAVLCLNLVLALAGAMTFQALIPTFIPLWGLTNTEAGWLSGVGFAAYAVVAPIGVTLTDRVDARLVLLTGALLSLLAGLGFALMASGFWDGLLWRMLAGIGIACGYMPGLKALTDRVHGAGLGRLQSVYTACYSLGMAASLLAAGLMAEALGWRSAFALSGILPALGGLLVLLAVPAQAPPPLVGTRLFDFRPVLKDHRLMRYILGYSGHCWELFGYRTWLVAFLTFAAARSGSGMGAEAIALLASSLLLLGLPASIFGNELATRRGRQWVLAGLMLASAALGTVLGFLTGLPFWLLASAAGLYAVLMMTDSAALTVGMLGHADPARRGATIAVQQCLGTLAAVMAPLASGMALDRLGNDTPAGWTAALAVLALGAGCGALAVLAYPAPASAVTSSQPK